MKICSYTLEEMLCFPWYERYERSQEDTDSILRSVGKVLAAAQPRYFKESIGEHVFEEKFSERQYLLCARHDYFCPLFEDSNSPVAFIVTSKVNILEARRSPHQERVGIQPDNQPII